MTKLAERTPTAPYDADPPRPALPSSAWPRRVPRRIPRPRLLSPSWPLTVLLVGFPALWALGLAAFALQVVAIPMAVELFRRRPVRVPAGFGLWCLFLLCSGAGLLVLGVDPTGTVPDSLSGRLVAYGTRESGYVAATVLLLYVGNLAREELSDRRVIGQLSWFFVSVTIGGVLGLLFPHFSFASPTEYLLPQRITTNAYVQHLLHPALAQVQELGGDALPRPAAPFAYTNTWGSQISLLAVWFVVGWLVLRSSRGTWRRVLAVPLLLVAVVTVVYSLNRGVWIGVAFTVGYVAVLLARRGRRALLAGLLLAIVAGGAIALQSPLRNVFEHRVENGRSNSVRAFTTERAFDLANRSPAIGFGSTRNAIGSASSIAVGKTASCQNCGNIAIGINGSFFTLIVSTGYLGALLFFGFWAVQLWRSRSDASLVGVACRLTLLLGVLYSFFYSVELVLPFLAMALLWRRRTGGDDVDEPDEPDEAVDLAPDAPGGRAADSLDSAGRVRRTGAHAVRHA